jgi:putative tricarboxylic transport membrane protein
MVEMAHSFFLGFSQIFSVTSFSLMLLGIAIGFVVGILPGLGGPTALALMIPFTFKMQPVEAFAFLLGMASVAATTGDITSILIGIPGEPTTAAVIVDGYPLTRKGEAGRALGAVLVSSLMGSIFGAFSLAAAIPIVRPLVLTFGSPEFFMLSIVGLTFVASLSRGSLLKGLAAGAIGLFLATIGRCPINGIQRFTFGQTFLWDGIGLVPLTVGFFAIPEIIDLAVTGTSIAGGSASKLGGIMEGVKDALRHWWLVIRCSAIGSFIGTIPGMGAATTQWLAYAHAVQSSKNKEQFGKGCIEGVLGPGAASNSTLGGMLITTTAFGVPISTMMAILLGAFLVQGVLPGPDMLVPEPKGHLALTFSFVWTIVVSNIITVSACFLFLNQLVKLTRIRGSLLVPFLILLTYLGAFAEKNAFEDVLLVLLFGVLGWVMTRVDWPRPPLILGLVLGPLAEKRLFLSIDNYGLAWLLHPGVLFLLLLTLAGALYPAIRAKRKRNQDKQELSSSERAGRSETGLLTYDRASLFTLFIITIMGVALWSSRHFNFRTGLFPWFSGFAVLAVAVAQMAFELTGSGNKNENRVKEDSDLPANVVSRRTATAFAWILSYFGAIWLLGFSVGGPLCTFIHLKIGGREKWLRTFILAIFSWIFIYGLFDQVLHLPFPMGSLFQWLSVEPA